MVYEEKEEVDYKLTEKYVSNVKLKTKSLIDVFSVEKQDYKMV